MLPSWCKVATKVVCVDINWQNISLFSNKQVPELNKIYTIIKTDEILECLYFKEVHNYITELKRERGFYYWHFRPLISKSQDDDIKLFNKILNETKIDEPA